MFPISKLINYQIFLKDNDTLFQKDDLYNSNFLILNLIKSFDFGKKTETKRKFYFIYKINWKVINGDYLKMKYNQCDIDYNRAMSNFNCPYYFYDNENNITEYIFVITK